MSDLEPFRVTSFAGFVGSIPHALGYTPSERQVVVAGIDGTAPKGLAVINFDDPKTIGQSDQDIAMDAVFTGVVPMFEHVGVDRYVVFAYGADAEEKAKTVADLITQYASTNHFVERLATREGNASSYDIIQGWSRPQPVPDLAAEWVARGATLTENRESHIASLTRDPDAPHRSSLPDAERAALTELRPSDRAAEATAIINAAAQPGPDDAHALTRLGALMNDHIAVRDSATMAAASSPEKADVLLRAFIGAPPEHADVLAAGAAFANYLTHGSTLATTTLAGQVSPDSPHASFAKLTQDLTALPAALAKAELPTAMNASVLSDLDAADQKWTAQRVRAATFPPPGTTHNRSAEPPRHGGTTPHPGRDKDTGHEK